MRKAVALRHVAFEDLGSLAPLLARRDFAMVYADAPTAKFADIEAMDADLLVVLGGPIGVYDKAAYPFLEHEVGLIRRRLEAARPTLGICLGCQLMAHALGAKVYPSGTKEIGWKPLVLTEAGRKSCLAPLADGEVSVLHWHGDTFDLPAGTVHLAETEVCKHQAFRIGHHGLALQFHLEATAEGLEAWYVGHTCEIGTTADVTVNGLRADARRCAAVLAPRAKAVFNAWLDEAGL